MLLMMKSGVVLNKITRFWTKMTQFTITLGFVIQLIKLVQPQHAFENVIVSVMEPYIRIVYTNNMLIYEKAWGLFQNTIFNYHRVL